MPLFVVHPSRGAWAFFGLVALGIAALRGYGSYERSVVRRDGPASEIAQELATCVFAKDAMWLLRDEPQAVWQQNMADWMRRVVTHPQEGRWPGRCVPVADRLVEKLSRAPGPPERVISLARLVRNQLDAAGRERFELVELADSDRFSTQLATLFSQVREISQGTREKWAPVPPNVERYGELRVPELPRLDPLGAVVHRPTLASATTVVYASLVDGMAHSIELTEGGHRDAAIAPAMPWREPAHDGVLRAETDASPALVTGGDVPRVVPFPRGFSIDGPPREFAWDAAVSGDALALVALDYGTFAAYATPRDGPVQWTPPASPGEEAERALAAVVAPGGGPGTWRVSVLRAVVHDGVLDQYSLTRALPPAALEDPAATDDRRRARGDRRAVSEEAPVVAQAPAEATLNVSPRVTRREGVLVPGARVATCAHGALRYIAVGGDRNVTVLRIQGADVQEGHAQGSWEHADRLTLSCDRDRALVGAVPMAARGAYHLLTFGRGEGATVTPIEVPMHGPSALLRGVDLVTGGVVALVSNQSTLRTYSYVPRGRESFRWEPAGLVALLKPARRPERTLRRVTLATRGNTVTVLLEGMLETPAVRTAPRPAAAEGEGDPTAAPENVPPARVEPYVTVATSSDGGRHFSSP